MDDLLNYKEKYMIDCHTIHDTGQENDAILRGTQVSSNVLTMIYLLKCVEGTCLFSLIYTNRTLTATYVYFGVKKKFKTSFLLKRKDT